MVAFVEGGEAGIPTFRDAPPWPLPAGILVYFIDIVGM